MTNVSILSKSHHILMWFDTRSVVMQEVVYLCFQSFGRCITFLKFCLLIVLTILSIKGIIKLKIDIIDNFSVTIIIVLSGRTHSFPINCNKCHIDIASLVLFIGRWFPLDLSLISSVTNWEQIWIDYKSHYMLMAMMIIDIIWYLCVWEWMLYWFFL